MRKFMRLFFITHQSKNTRKINWAAPFDVKAFWVRYTHPVSRAFDVDPSFGQCGLHSYAERAVKAFGRTWAHDGRCESKKKQQMDNIVQK